MKSGAESRLEVLFRDAGGKRPCSERIHVVSMRNICSRGRTSVRANRSVLGDRRVVDEKLVLADESDVYNDSKGSSGYEQGSDEKNEDLYKPP
jgi:hypothetical protein